MFRGIRFKLAFLTFILVALFTSASSFIVTNIVNRVILNELFQRGYSLGKGAATAAGYSLLSDDRLALYNLTAKLKEYQEDVLFVSIVDHTGKILAHSMFKETGSEYEPSEGTILKTLADGSTVSKTTMGNKTILEFEVPVFFAEKKVGAVYLGIDHDTLVKAQAQVQRSILTVSLVILLLGAISVFFLSAFITTPVKKLTNKVSQLASGTYPGEIQSVSKDEIGVLTSNFNKMARIITEQRLHLERYNKDLEVAYVATIKILAAAIDARDPYTLGHSERVARFSVLIGEKLNLNPGQLKDLETSCLFHDVGKMRTPDLILLKDDSLTDEEFLLMKKHPEDGAEILQIVESLHKHIPAVHHHHEWHNGEGYPDGLKGDEIPLHAAIIAIADAYDALTSKRSYKEAKSKEAAMEELKRCRGTQFNPCITDIFIEILAESETKHKQVVNV